jgi:hypothetical protein
VLTKLTVRRFKRFDEVEIELGSPVVFVGPNDSGKTTALQALALWEVGLRRWLEKRGTGRKAPEKRFGVTINRRDLIAVPVPDAIYLWRNLNVRRATRDAEGKRRTENIRVDILVDGVTDGKAWTCGLEFDYANEEALYCRPLRVGSERMEIPEQAKNVRLAFLPPMSGLAANETRLDEGAINVRIGEGRTAEVLRNLCYGVLNAGDEQWARLHERIRSLFGPELHEPVYLAERGEITMSYEDPSGTTLDLSSSGRGMQQTLLLLAHLTLNPGSVLLLDEPDAHLEILRQRQIYQVLTEAAGEQDSQIIAASHSEVVLNEAADRDVVVAFVGKPHRIDDRGSQVLKALKEIGFEDYYQAELTGWVLYLEGATDLAILRAFAESLGHAAAAVLARPFVKYVMNQPSKAREHFFGLREAKPDLVGFALFDRIDASLQDHEGLREYAWSRREIENYLCQRETLLAWTEAEAGEGTLFASQHQGEMEAAISEIDDALDRLGRDSAWSPDLKVSEDFLGPVFASFYKKLGLPNAMQKSDFHVLARFVPKDSIDREVVEVLDTIVEVASRATPRSGEAP